MEPRRTNALAAPSPLEALAAAAPMAGPDNQERFESLLDETLTGEAALQSVAGTLSGAPGGQEPAMDLAQREIIAAEDTVAEAGGEAASGALQPEMPTDSPGELIHITTTVDQNPLGQHHVAVETTVVVVSPLHAAAFASSTRGISGPAGSGSDHSPTESVLRLEVDAARLMKRVARALATAEQGGDGEIRLRLSPPELGSLKLELRVEEGALIARMEAETQDARSVLLDNLPLLRERLGEQGMRIERFDVDLMQHQTGDQQHAPPDRDRSTPQATPATRQPPSAAAAMPEAGNRRTPFPRRKRGRLNVII